MGNEDKDNLRYLEISVEKLFLKREGLYYDLSHSPVIWYITFLPPYLPTLKPSNYHVKIIHKEGLTII